FTEGEGNRGKSLGLSRRERGLADEVLEEWDGGAAWDGEPCAEVVPERDAELCAGLGETEEGVAAVSASIGAGATTDLALDDVAADVVLGAVGVERDVRAVEHPQQHGLVGMQASEQSVARDEAGSAFEDLVEAGPQGGLAERRRIAAVGLEV